MTTRREILQGAAASMLLPMVAGCSAAQPKDVAAGVLGTLRAVTITTTDLKGVEAAWTKYMDYRVIDRGRLSQATVESWGAPALRDKGFVILGPQNGEPTYLRFVEQPLPQGYDPKQRALGWNMTEITVQNSDKLYERLHGSPFILRGPPKQVATYSYLRALGAVGPAGETLAFTWITEKRPDLAVAESFVGRVFIATLHVPDLPESLKWFEATFGNYASPIRQLSPTLQLSVVTLREGTKIEVDHLGPQAKPRPRPPGGLPPGLALVTFECSRFDRFQDRFLRPAAASVIHPHRGARTATMLGSAGELMELVDV